MQKTISVIGRNKFYIEHVLSLNGDLRLMKCNLVVVTQFNDGNVQACSMKRTHWKEEETLLLVRRFFILSYLLIQCPHTYRHTFFIEPRAPRVLLVFFTFTLILRSLIEFIQLLLRLHSNGVLFTFAYTYIVCHSEWNTTRIIRIFSLTILKLVDLWIAHTVQ